MNHHTHARGRPALARASGRNGGGIRQQWGAELNTRLMKESVELRNCFAHELGVNVWFRKGGDYLFLAREEVQVARLEHTVELQKRCGLPTHMMGLKQVKDLVPQLSTDGLLAGCYTNVRGSDTSDPLLCH